MLRRCRWNVIHSPKEQCSSIVYDLMVKLLLLETRMTMQFGLDQARILTSRIVSFKDNRLYEIVIKTLLDPLQVISANFTQKTRETLG